MLGYDFSNSLSQKYIYSDSESEKDNYLNNDIALNIFPFFQNINKDHINLNEESKEKNNEIYFNDNKEKEEKSPQNENSPQFIVKKRKRGPEKKTDNYKTHRHDATDNCLRMIKVHYLSFIVSFLNNILKKEQYKQKFYNLKYDFKKTTNKKEINSLKGKTIGQIIANNISDKYKCKNSNYNQKLFEQITNNKDSKVLNNILSENYLELFKKIYFKSTNIINFGEYGLDRAIHLSNKVKMFKDLLLELRANDKSFYRNMQICVKRNFIKDLIFLVN